MGRERKEKKGRDGKGKLSKEKGKERKRREGIGSEGKS